MIDPALFKNPVGLDRERHVNLKVRTDHKPLTRTAGMNALFLTAVEFADACKEYPVVFIPAGKSPEGKDEVAPIVVLGLTRGENLYLGQDGQWSARYLPALVRGYPFAMAPMGEGRYAVCVDQDYEGLSETEGVALFDAKGEPTTQLTEIQQYLEQLENEVLRTRAFCQRLLDLGLLQPMQFDATLPDGQEIKVDGFLTVDDKKLAGLTDSELGELHRSGMLGLLHAHQISLGLMRRLVEVRLEKAAA